MKFLWYILVSAICLAVDVGIFLATINLGLWPVLAGALGYLIGAVLHYFLSVMLVFQAAKRPFSHRRKIELLLYAMTALIGTALTAAIIAGADLIFPGIEPTHAKAIAVAVTFITIYLLRAKFLMRAVDPAKAKLAHTAAE